MTQRYYLTSLFIALLLGVSVEAQETVRSSAAGEGNAVNHTPSEGGAYNIKAGPILFKMAAGVNTSFNDNINLSETGAESDFIITPNISVNANWPVSAINNLSLTLGLGYSKYINNPSADSKYVNIAPDSGLNFNVFVGDFKFTFFDNFSFQQDPVDEIALANVTTFSRFSNSVGMNVDWDLNDVVLTAGYSHNDFIPMSDSFKYTESSSETFTQRTSFTITPTITAGLSSSLSFTNYSQDFLNNNWTVMSGPFATIQLSPKLSLNATAGAQYINSKTDGAVGDSTGTVTSWYSSLGLTHEINNYINQTLTLSKSNPTGLNSDFVGLFSIQHSVTWQIIRDVSLSTNEFLEYGEDSGGTLAENTLRYGGGINLGYTLTQKTSLSLGYTHTERDSDVAGRNYSQNVVTLGASYSF